MFQICSSTLSCVSYLKHEFPKRKAMSEKTLPEAGELATRLGRHLRAARLARRDSQAVMAQRAGVSRSTIARLEAGDSGVSVGHMLAVLAVLGMAGPMVDAVSPARDATAPDRLPRRGRGGAKVARDWGEDLF
jgi:DNA-binding XRE family transcriptional regulator